MAASVTGTGHPRPRMRSAEIAGICAAVFCVAGLALAALEVVDARALARSPGDVARPVAMLLLNAMGQLVGTFPGFHAGPEHGRGWTQAAGPAQRRLPGD